MINKTLSPTTTKKDEKTSSSQLKSTEESQVIILVTLRPRTEKQLLRLWKTIYLFAHDSDHKSRLIYFENISFHPQWTELPANQSFHFTLIFSGLPKSCQKFDLIEVIPQPGGFLKHNIKRNKEDVYHIDI